MVSIIPKPKLSSKVATARLRAERKGHSLAGFPPRVRRRYAPYGSKSHFARFAMVEFGFSRSTAYRMIEIAEAHRQRLKRDFPNI